MKAETPTQEVIDYLKKRHPLYFIAQKVSEEQITDLVNRLKYKLKQMQGMMGGTTTTMGLLKDTKESKKENQQSSSPATQANTRPQTASTRPQTATTASSSLLGPLPSLTQQ
jgi:phosphomevalonate kinase